MFARLGRSVVAHPWRVIAIWLVAAVALVVSAPSLSSITNRDQTKFLPDSFESVQAQQLAESAFPQAAAATSTIVVRRHDGGQLTDADQRAVATLAASLQERRIAHVLAVTTSPQLVSANRRVALVSLVLDGALTDEAVTDAVVSVRDALPDVIRGTDLEAGVTGQAATILDTRNKFETAERIVSVVTIVLIVVLMLLMFRSPLAALLPILSVTLVMLVSTALIALAGKTLDFEIGQELPILLTVVLFGIGTDYILFLLFRYRERLRRGDSNDDAVRTAVHKIGEAISSAAGAVIVAFSALALSSFKGFKAMGPVLAVAVACMLVAALTLIPAIISLIGPRVFWPSRAWQSEPRAALSRSTGRLVARRPVLLAAGGSLTLLLIAVGALGMHQNYESVGSPQKGTEAADWYDRLQVGFPAGATNPTSVYLHSTDDRVLDPVAVTDYATALGRVHGVGAVQPGGVDADRRPVPYMLSHDGTVAQVNLLLDDNPFSNVAMDNVKNEVRSAAHAQAPPGTEAKVGGMTSAFVDVRSATSRDLAVILPVAGVLILLILAVLLRAVLAPLYLMVAVVLGYLATLGATTLAFQRIGDEPGLMFILPMFVYLFVVAIGTDYNILMIARLREEAQQGLPPREAAAKAVEHSGPSIASAGIILAGTFCSLLFAGFTLMSQMGFAVAIGIVMAAFIMAMLVVPAVTALVGHAAWWPGHRDRADLAGLEDPGHIERAEAVTPAGI